MKQRHEKFEAEKGIPPEVSEGTSEELIIRDLPTVSAEEYAKVLSVYTDKDGNKVAVPPGWTVSGKREENTIWGKNKGLVIYKIPQVKVSDINWSSKQIVESLQKTYNQLTWCPVEKLDSNGTLDGVSFTEKFGRRNYRNDEFSEYEFNEPLTDELALQLESVKKYGGFYISRYAISKNKKTGEPQSIKSEFPWTNIDFCDAKKVAAMLETSDTITSHLPFGSEYDSVLEWFIKSNTKTLEDIAEDSTECGNYCNTENSSGKIVETGSREDGCINNICGIAGNVSEWTQERNGVLRRALRSGDFHSIGSNYPVSYRGCGNAIFVIFEGAGFRATIYIK